MVKEARKRLIISFSGLFFGKSTKREQGGLLCTKKALSLIGADVNDWDKIQDFRITSC